LALSYFLDAGQSAPTENGEHFVPDPAVTSQLRTLAALLMFEPTSATAVPFLRLVLSLPRDERGHIPVEFYGRILALIDRLSKKGAAPRVSS
jgi:hypothetical protein